jgi:hypothetical protein
LLTFGNIVCIRRQRYKQEYEKSQHAVKFVHVFFRHRTGEPFIIQQLVSPSVYP